MSCTLSGMATDLFGPHRNLSSLLEIEGPRSIRGLKSKDSIQKLAKVLLKSSWQKVLHILVELMEKSKQDSRESVRRTIMEHDEVFRQQVHELHRLYRVQKSLMAELGGEKHRFQSRTEETQEMMQEPRSNLKNSPSTSETSQSAHLGQHSTPEHSILQEFKPATCLNFFTEETSRTQEFRREGGRSVGGENWSTSDPSVESDLDLKLTIGPSLHATKAPHWLFSGSRDRNPSGQHR
ncbi:uncharacterized protein LOC102722587 [Oryza brachyantha]|uniref:Uncharacterized protein n=1 Tax=Oryza brachyantha TaxID=4533 RepID=J3MH52_ORYBR|nr:uncharacterized protein LOC102722587 [Oryza brachyantha]